MLLLPPSDYLSQQEEHAMPSRPKRRSPKRGRRQVRGYKPYNCGNTPTNEVRVVVENAVAQTDKGFFVDGLYVVCTKCDNAVTVVGDSRRSLGLAYGLLTKSCDHARVTYVGTIPSEA